MTGLYPRLVAIIYEETGPEIQKGRAYKKSILQRKESINSTGKCKISAFYRLLMILTWIKTGYSFRFLGKMFGVSAAFLCREVEHILPILHQKIRTIISLMKNF